MWKHDWQRPFFSESTEFLLQLIDCHNWSQPSAAFLWCNSVCLCRSTLGWWHRICVFLSCADCVCPGEISMIIFQHRYNAMMCASIFCRWIAWITYTQRRSSRSFSTLSLCLLGEWDRVLAGASGLRRYPKTHSNPRIDFFQSLWNLAKVGHALCRCDNNNVQ